MVQTSRPHHPETPDVLRTFGRDGWHLTVTQERHETRLGEMVIVCQHFGNAPLVHDEERRAIGEPPLFVWALGIQRERRGKLRLRLRNNIDIRVVLQAAHNLYGTLAEGLAQRRIMVEELCQDHLTRDERAALQGVADRDGFRVPLITRIQQGNSIARISEYGVHACFLGAPYK
jgi:hypothetical protein